jgi:hypothetical protein
MASDKAEDSSDRFERQIRFILEVDKLKSIIRRTYLVNADRAENTAEHSWHLAIMAILLAEHANETVEVARVVKMVLIHDIVEIDAGDTYFYDSTAALDKADRERAAADRIFGMLPLDQSTELRALWDEFESGRRRKLDSRLLWIVSFRNCTTTIRREDRGPNMESPRTACWREMRPWLKVLSGCGSARALYWTTPSQRLPGQERKVTIRRCQRAILFQ